jgi:hypothetical protein
VAALVDILALAEGVIVILVVVQQRVQVAAVVVGVKVAIMEDQAAALEY